MRPLRASRAVRTRVYTALVKPLSPAASRKGRQCHTGRALALRITASRGYQPPLIKPGHPVTGGCVCLAGPTNPYRTPACLSVSQSAGLSASE